MRTCVIYLALYILLTLCACTSTQHVALDFSDKKSPKIEIFLSEVQKPVKEYEVISYAETSGAIFANKNNLLRALKRKAVELGGDAVINVRFFYIPHTFSGLPAVEGVIIKYK